jgi:hypothetical protein
MKREEHPLSHVQDRGPINHKFDDSSDDRDHPACKKYVLNKILEDLRGLQTDFTFENSTCARGYDITKDDQMCIRGDNEDCTNNNQTTYKTHCDGSRGRDGLIFCDIYVTFTGSRIAYGGCYDRNDNPFEYCSHFAKEEQRNDDGWTCKNLL